MLVTVVVVAVITVLAFTAGVLVGAHNAKKVTADVTAASTAASAVVTAAADVKKAV